MLIGAPFSALSGGGRAISPRSSISCERASVVFRSWQERQIDNGDDCAEAQTPDIDNTDDEEYVMLPGVRPGPDPATVGSDPAAA
jgi:hypothetical protein